MSKIATLNYQFTFEPDKTWQTVSEFNNWLLKALNDSKLTAEKINGVENGLAISPKEDHAVANQEPEKKDKAPNEANSLSAGIARKLNEHARVKITVEA